MQPGFAPDSGEAIPLFLIRKSQTAAALDALDPAARAWVERTGFAGALGDMALVPDGEGGVSEALFGWGDAAARKRRRFALAQFADAAPAGDYRIETDLPPEDADEAALAWLLAAYRFDRYKDAKPLKARLVAPAGVNADRLIAIAEGAYLTRDLVNTPANDMGPEALEQAARGLADAHNASIDVITGEALLDANFPMIHTVGRAAAEAPRLIDMVWGRDDAPKVTLVGKGVCFDTGGLDLKPAAAMRLMKKDMGGAATVLGLAHMIMSLGLPIRLRVLVPAVENAVSANAFRPGDILTSRQGLTVEIGNTDAEGRLVLADALSLAAEEDPEILIDMATLTGAARVALGPELPAMFTDDAELADGLDRAARACRDPLWRLPLWPGYEDDVKSPVADLDNAPPGGMAGAITAALFLKRFVGDCPWAHFDIYAWNPAAKPARPKGGECMAARACLSMLEARYGG